MPTPQSHQISGQNIDLTEIETSLGTVGESIAGELDDLFKQFGETILSELQNAVRGDAVDLRNLLSSALNELAQLATRQIFSPTPTPTAPASHSSNLSSITPSQTPYSAPMNVTVNMTSGDSASQALGSINQVSAAIAQATLRGRRFI